MARAGRSVLVLEKSTVYRDHVRGEWIAPWGVVELTRLGLYDAVRAGGGHPPRPVGARRDAVAQEARGAPASEVKADAVTTRGKSAEAAYSIHLSTARL